MLFLFFQNFDFVGFQGVKGKKMAQNDKNLYLCHSVSQELYLIWLWVLVNMVAKINNDISSNLFPFFQNYL